MYQPDADYPVVSKPPPPFIKAWHCGSKGQDMAFDFDYFRTGEGHSFPPLGPGIYFAQSRGIAAQYCKYAHKKGKQPYLCQAIIDTRNMMGYSDAGHTNLHVNKRLKDLVQRMIPNAESFHGYGNIETLVKRFGWDKAREMLVEAGIAGYFEPVMGGFEIAVYDLSALKEVSCTKVDMADHDWFRRAFLEARIDNSVFQEHPMPEEEYQRLLDYSKKTKLEMYLRRNPGCQKCQHCGGCQENTGN